MITETGVRRPSRRLRDLRPRTALELWVVTPVLGWTALYCLKWLGLGALAPDTMAGFYNASAYWVSYRDGFVRRGLPGAVLEAVLGRPPGVFAASVVAVLLVLLVLAALAALTVAAVRATPSPQDRVVVAALVLASPFTLTLAVINRGRYDAIVVACVVAVVLLARRRTVPLLRVLGISLAVVVGVGSLEISLTFLGPLALLAAVRLGRTTAERVGWGALAVLPGLALAAASLVVRPGVGTLLTIMERASAAGIPLSRSEENSISALGQTTRDALVHTAGIAPLTILFCAVVLGGCYALTAGLLWTYLGHVHPRWALALLSLYGFGALALSAVGDDYRRWWGFAFVAMVASLVLLRRDAVIIPAPRHADGPPGRRLLVVALLVSAAMALFPIWPSWDQSGTNASIDQVQQD
ncbi:hypothetical protein GCM10009836_71230 [Pseudonocardia ailaonensis]|uniref:Uncharacterized protein n=1 Tax=Pseudonocardia ailaonensis TaxID=367279 RepID=A0ABN2NPI4_9PSEU